MGRPLICNTCCPTDDPPPTTDCGGAIAVAFIDEISSFRDQSAKIAKYVEAYPNRLLFVLDVASRDISYDSAFLASDQCYCLKQEASNPTPGVPRYITRDSDRGGGSLGNTPSDILAIIKAIINGSPKSSAEKVEIFNKATQVSVFRDDSGSMKANEVKRAYDNFKDALLLEPTPKTITFSVENAREDFVCPFVFEHCCGNQAAADVIALCGLPECIPAELRFFTHPSGPYVIDDPCDSASCNNSEGGCSSCPTVITNDYTVKYKAAAVESNGHILTHPDIDYYLQYRDSADGTFENLYDLPDAKSNVEQSLDVLLKNWGGGGGSDLTGFNHVQNLGPTVVGELVGERGSFRFGHDNAMSANGDTIVIVEQRPALGVASPGFNEALRSARICTYKRSVNTTVIDPPPGSPQGPTCYTHINYELVDEFLTSEPIDGIDNARASIDLSDDGLTLIVGTPDNGTPIEGTELWPAATGEWRVYDWAASSSSWVQRGSVGTISTDASEGKEIGFMAAISSDGDTAVVSTDYIWKGILHNQFVYVYTWNGTSWVQRGSGIRDSGSERLKDSGYPRYFSVDANVDYIVISTDKYDVPLNPDGRDNHGAVRVFVYNDSLSEWNQIGNMITTSTVQAYVGLAVCISKVTSLTPTKEARIAVADKTSVYVYDYDENTDTWVQKGNTISRDNLDEIITHGQKNPSMSFSEDKNTLIIGDYSPVVNNNQRGQVKVLKLVGNTWTQSNSFHAINENFDYFGTDVLLSRRGFSVSDPCSLSGGQKNFGKTMLFSAPLHGEDTSVIYHSGGQAQIYVTEATAPDCFTCHPLISQHGNPASSCDEFEDHDIGNGCTRRVFKREFRIMASSDTMTSVFSDPFKLYQYFGVGGDIDPPDITGDWVREFTTTTDGRGDVNNFPAAVPAIGKPGEKQIISRFDMRRTNDTAGQHAFLGEMTHFELCPAIVDKCRTDSYHDNWFAFQRLLVSSPYYPSENKGSIQHYVFGSYLDLHNSEGAATDWLENGNDWFFEDFPFKTTSSAHAGTINDQYLGHAIAPIRSKLSKPHGLAANLSAAEGKTVVPVGFWFMKNTTELAFVEAYGGRDFSSVLAVCPLRNHSYGSLHNLMAPYPTIQCDRVDGGQFDLSVREIIPSVGMAQIATDGDGDTVAVSSPYDQGITTPVTVIRSYGGTETQFQSVHEIFSSDLDTSATHWKPNSLCLNGAGNVLGYTYRSANTSQDTGNVAIYELLGETFFSEQPSQPQMYQQWKKRDVAGLIQLLGPHSNLSILKMDKSGNNFIVSCTNGRVQTSSHSEITGWAQVFTYDAASNQYKAKGQRLEGTYFNGQFGIDCDISSDGQSVVVSSREPNTSRPQDPTYPHHGAIRCYSWNGTSWEQLGDAIRGSQPWSNLGFHLSYEADHVKRIAAFEGTDHQGNHELGDISMYRFEER